MEGLNNKDILFLLMQLATILIVARIFGEITKMLKQPAVLGEILAGILLGPSFFGYFFPDYFSWLYHSSQNSFIVLEGLSSLGVILLLFVAGMELELSLILQKGKATFIISFFSLVIPLIIGFFTVYYLNDFFNIQDSDKAVYGTFLGIVLSVSALPVLAKILLDLNLLRTKIGVILLSAAMADDILAWILFSILLSLTVASISVGQIVFSTFLIIVFVLFILTIARVIINKSLPLIIKFIDGPGGVIAFALVLCLISSLLTQYLGIHSIFGAFLIGIAVGNSEHFEHMHREIIHQFTSSFFAPLFFVMTGLKINMIANFNLGIVLIVLFIATLSKVGGTLIGAYFLKSQNKYESLAIGFGLNARGEIAIVLGLIGYEANLINSDTFIAIVFVGLFTSILAGPILGFLSKYIRNRSFADLVENKLVYFTNCNNKSDLLKELCKVASANYKLNEKELHLEVLRREQLISTGLQNHLAIPHAKFSVASPIVIIAVSKDGIEFDSLDGLPAKVIIFLITPYGENDLQLNLLAEIAKKLGALQNTQKIASLDSIDEIIKTIKKL